MADTKTIILTVNPDTMQPVAVLSSGRGDILITAAGSGPLCDIPAAGEAAVVTLAAPGAGLRWRFDYLHWSYNDDPTGGYLRVTDGFTTEHNYVTQGGPGFLPFPTTEYQENQPVTVTLGPGGAGVSGSLAVHGARTEAV